MQAQRSRQRMTDASTVRVPGKAPRWIIPAVKVGLLITDLTLTVSSFFIAFYLREGISPVTSEMPFHLSAAFAPYGALLLFVVAIRLLTLRYCDLYRLRGEFSFVDDGIRVFKAVAIGSLLIVAVAFVYRGGFEFRAFSYARGVFVVDFLLSLVGFTTVRFLVRAVQKFARNRQVNLYTHTCRRTWTRSFAVHPGNEGAPRSWLSSNWSCR